MVTRRQQQLAFELGRLRSLAGMSGRQIAKALKVNQATVSRILNGTSRPTAAMAQTWLDAVDANREDRNRVLALLDAVHTETLPWAQALGKGGHYQDRAREQERSATLIRNFQPTVIPGLLQTPDYIAEVLPLAGVSGLEDHVAALAGRLQRQQILHEPGHEFRFLITQQVLQGLGVPGLAAAQADRLIQMANLPAVSLAIVPVSAPALPWHNFIIFDSALVTAELIHGPVELTEPDPVRLYELLWHRLWDAAATGDDALALISQS